MVSAEAATTKVADNELDRNLMEESHQMELENNNAPHLTQMPIVDYDETSEGKIGMFLFCRMNCKCYIIEYLFSSFPHLLTLVDFTSI